MKKTLNQMEREELAMSRLAQPTKICVRECGKTATLEALKWLLKNVKAIDESEFRSVPEVREDAEED